MQKKAVILFSGGLDSTTCLAIAKSEGYAPYALSFDYGQKHSSELEFAKHIAKQSGVVLHKIAHLPLAGSSLIDSNMAVSDYEDSNEIPNTYVPGRNTVFLAVALSWAEVVGASDIFIGANIVDYSQYPDCRPEFLNAFETLANLATKAGAEGQQFKIHAPLLQLSKAEIIKKGIALGIDYSKTVSCYRADKEGLACGTCDSCVFRKKGFAEAGVEDTTRYK